jgi:hypothetical protein
VITTWLSIMPVSVLDADAPSEEFSAERAAKMVQFILPNNVPHPVGSTENTAVRNRIIDAFSNLGVDVSTKTERMCRPAGRLSAITCAEIVNIVAPIKNGTGKPIILMAHYDSAPAASGAGDDIHGVALIMEVARAISNDDGFNNPVIALITDGEESGLLGARAYFQNETQASAAGVVINIEGRGNEGPSLLFETSKNAAWMVDMFGQHAERPFTNSLMRAAYKVLPNNTDLSASIGAGVPGLNFAFTDNFAHYHTALDRTENLSLNSVQHQGNNVLSMVRALKSVDLENPPEGDALYIDLFTRYLLMVPLGWLWPMVVVALALLTWYAFKTNREDSEQKVGWIKVTLAIIFFVPILLVLAGGIGYLLSLVAGIFGEKAPGFAQPLTMRLALYTGAWAVLLVGSNLAARWLSKRRAYFAVWGWVVIISSLFALFAPGAAVAFIFPAFFAAVMSAVSLRVLRKNRWAEYTTPVFQMIIWAPLVYLLEVMFGITGLAPIFISVVALIALLGSVPLITGKAQKTEEKMHSWVCPAVSMAIAAFLAIVTGFLPSFSDDKPMRFNIVHVSDERSGKVEWRLQNQSNVDILPSRMREVIEFSDKPKPGIPFILPRGFAASAPVNSTSERLIELLEIVEGEESRRVKLRLKAPDDGGIAALFISAAAMPSSVALDGIEQVFEFNDNDFQGYHVLLCSGGNCGTAEVTLKAKSVNPWVLVERRYGLPIEGQVLVDARPSWAVPSQDGDVTIKITEREI